MQKQLQELLQRLRQLGAPGVAFLWQSTQRFLSCHACKVSKLIYEVVWHQGASTDQHLQTHSHQALCHETIFWQHPGGREANVLQGFQNGLRGVYGRWLHSCCNQLLRALLKLLLKMGRLLGRKLL